MTFTISARNVNDALPQGIALLREYGIREDSRNGPVLRLPRPCVTTLGRPQERVLLDPVRDANPFFHIVEAAWMIAGRNTLKDLTPYVPGMANYSDDGGKTQPAAYGKRWRDHFPGIGDEYGYFPEVDQINWAIKRLRADLTDRRVVINMWDPGVDIPTADANGRDVPCNLTMIPWVMDGSLHLTVFNRSHDIVWGLFGANAVHFSVALEYMAGRLNNMPVGTLTFFSNNFHAYDSTMPEEGRPRPGDRNGWFSDPYQARKAADPVMLYPLYDSWELGFPHWQGPEALADEYREKQLQQDLLIFFDHGWREAATKARWPWMRQVLCPMAAAHAHFKGMVGEDRYLGALEILEQCQAQDWRLSAQQWVRRRHERWRRATDDGASHE